MVHECDQRLHQTSFFHFIDLSLSPRSLVLHVSFLPSASLLLHPSFLLFLYFTSLFPYFLFHSYFLVSIIMLFPSSIPPSSSLVLLPDSSFLPFLHILLSFLASFLIQFLHHLCLTFRCIFLSVFLFVLHLFSFFSSHPFMFVPSLPHPTFLKMFTSLFLSFFQPFITSFFLFTSFNLTSVSLFKSSNLFYFLSSLLLLFFPPSFIIFHFISCVSFLLLPFLLLIFCFLLSFVLPLFPATPSSSSFISSRVRQIFDFLLPLCPLNCFPSSSCFPASIPSSFSRLSSSSCLIQTLPFSLYFPSFPSS